tara:strand:+ start:9811 stop:10182 length:372 start_codon:yes stop_codon:yes gene_type:complete
MEKLVLSGVLLFIYFFGGVILMRLFDLSVQSADKSMKAVPKLILGTFQLAFVILKALIRLSVRAWRFYKPGSVVREPRQEVGQSDIHVRVNPLKTKTLGQTNAFNFLETERRAPVIIEASTHD